MVFQKLVAQGFSLVFVLAIAYPAFTQEVLPDGPGKEPTQRICSQCHEAAKAASIKLTRQGWNEEIDKMKALGAQASEQDFQTILDYLAAALLQYRARRGPWKALADLKDLDPAILKKIEVKKDRIVFLSPTK